MAEVMNSLFGITPESLMAKREEDLQAQAMQYAKMDPFQRASAGIYKGASQLGGALGGMLGAQDPEMQKAATLQGILKNAVTTTPEGLATLAQTLASQGFGQQAMQVMDQARQSQLQAAQLGKARIEEQRMTLSAAKEDAMTKELAALPFDATQEDYLKVVTKYGDAKTILPTLQASIDRSTQRQQQADLQKERIQARIDEAKAAAENRLELARQQGATQLQIAQMADQSRRDIAQMQADARKDVATTTAAMKGPSAAVIKAQEKADKIAEGQAGLADTVSVAKTLVKDIADMGGMTTTSKGALANLMTSLGTGTVGQAGARLVGTPTQAKRDELNSVRLQLFNAVKEATGMSSTQLNSNVELQTWLKSLGSDTMSKEANLAILDNIENRYLKNKDMKPTGDAKESPKPPMYAVNPTTKERIMSTDGGKTWTQAR